jgi:hypothetical protein
MKLHGVRWTILSVLAAASSGPAAADSAQELAARLAAAHGGRAVWEAAPTVSYDHTLEFDEDEGRHWRSIEVIERDTGLAYQQYPNHGSRLAWNGREVWTQNWSIGNPPKVMVRLNYNSLIAPFLSLFPGATLEAAPPARLPGETQDLPSFVVRFPKDASRPPNAVYYRMYLDPRTFRLRAVEYAVGYGPLLDLMGAPPGADRVGPIIHVYDAWTEVDGLSVTSRYHTIGTDGAVYGKHTVTGWSLRRPFDATRLVRPPDGVVDSSTDTRARAGS